MRYSEILEACWKGYRKDGMKTMFGKRYPNCVKIKKQSEGVAEADRVARKAGQPADSKKHSDLYTDENPRGTITGLKFATVEDARASVTKIRNSGRSHAHKIQAAVAMEQRAKAAGKASAAAVYRRYINANKKTNEEQGVEEAVSKKDLVDRLQKDLPKVMDPKNKKAKPVNWTGPGKDEYGYTGYQGHGMPTDKQERDSAKKTDEQQLDEKCWDGYSQQGMKNKGGRQVPNCVAMSEQELEEDLKKWFKQKWVRFGPDGKIRGPCARGKSSEGKPKCLPQAKAHALGKKGRAAAGARKRKQDPDANRSGKAKNVATKANESLRRGEYYIATVTLDNGDVKKIKVRSDEGYDDAIRKHYAAKGHTVVDIDMNFDIQEPVGEAQNIADGIPFDQCPACGGSIVHESELNEKQDACYHKVKSRYKVWPSAYASGALVQCRKKGAANWGNGKK